jgi:2,3-diaminopropionate biosynthesis protein SbnB
MIVIRHAEVARILADRHAEVIDIARLAYKAHDEGRTVVPHSLFLRFPGDSANRIIALPAFLDDGSAVAGVKWISSFPANTRVGLPRASAAIVLNDMADGRADAVIEGSLISAKRTAAGVALAAELLASVPPTRLAFVGCGVINGEVLRYLTSNARELTRLTVFDTDPARAAAFGRACRAAASAADVRVAGDLDEALADHDLISIATTATVPHLDLDACEPGALVAHLSLRDIRPESILRAQNVVDDPDHVCRERTSLQLAEELAGNRDFIDVSIGAVARGVPHFRRDPCRVLVFSPFGLGAVDMALARYVLAEATRLGLGTVIEGFHPAPPCGDRR